MFLKSQMSFNSFFSMVLFPCGPRHLAAHEMSLNEASPHAERFSPKSLIILTANFIPGDLETSAICQPKCHEVEEIVDYIDL